MGLVYYPAVAPEHERRRRRPRLHSAADVADVEDEPGVAALQPTRPSGDGPRGPGDPLRPADHQVDGACPGDVEEVTKPNAERDPRCAGRGIDHGVAGLPQAGLDEQREIGSEALGADKRRGVSRGGAHLGVGGATNRLRPEHVGRPHVRPVVRGDDSGDHGGRAAAAAVDGKESDDEAAVRREAQHVGDVVVVRRRIGRWTISCSTPRSSSMRGTSSGPRMCHLLPVAGTATRACPRSRAADQLRRPRVRRTLGRRVRRRAPAVAGGRPRAAGG